MRCTGEPLLSMAKIYGLFGAMSGKVADVVMSVRNGQQIVRKYQPVVANPKTQNQFTTRAQFKLLSQLSAVMAPVIAIPRVGAISSRNIFTKVNFPLTSFANNEASIELNSIQLTKSAVALPSLNAGRAEGALFAEMRPQDIVGGLNVSRIVYAMFEKTSDNRLRFVESKVATEAGDDGNWSVTFSNVTREVVILAYGVRDNTEAARIVFGNLEAVAAETVAKIITSRTLTEVDVTLTETRGTTVAANLNSTVSPADVDNMRGSKKK